MTNTSVARMKQSGIRDGSLPGFHFISSGLLVLTARWSRGSPARRQAGRGFWRMVQPQEKCRPDERSVIRHTKNRLRYVPCGRLRFASGGPRPAAGSICHRANLPYGLTVHVSVLIQADKAIR